LGGFADKARERIASHRAEAELAADVARSEDAEPQHPAAGRSIRGLLLRLRAVIRR
jgi:hypothetical protein